MDGKKAAFAAILKTQPGAAAVHDHFFACYISDTSASTLARAWRTSSAECTLNTCIFSGFSIFCTFPIAPFNLCPAMEFSFLLCRVELPGKPLWLKKSAGVGLF